jgi:hypothetical protein
MRPFFIVVSFLAAIAVTLRQAQDFIRKAQTVTSGLSLSWLSHG